MPWVNIFENEQCDVVMNLTQLANEWPANPDNVTTIPWPPAEVELNVESGDPMWLRNIGGGEGVWGIGVPPEDSDYNLYTGLYIVPSGGIAGRKFRARVVDQTSGSIDPTQDEGHLQCPGYFVPGCGYEAAYDEAAFVPHSPDGEPPVTSEWYEFETVAPEPEGDNDETGWVGLFNYQQTGAPYGARGFYEWQVWVEDNGNGNGNDSCPPWWLCKSKNPVEPCPVRPTDFVPFSEYDPDFKFPLQSSRKPSRIVRADGCVVCAPTLIEQVEPEPPPPPPPPECEFPSPWQVEINDDMFARITYEGTLLTPSNYDDYLPNSELIATTGNAGDSSADTEYRFVFYQDDADGYNFDITESSGLPFPDCLNTFFEYTEGGYTNYAGLANCCVEPPTICAAMTVQPYEPTVFNDFNGDMTNAPDWFVYGDTSAFVVAFEDDWDNYYTFTWNGDDAYIADGVLPFESSDQILNMMIAIPEDDAPSNYDWSCINISTYAPA